MHTWYPILETAIRIQLCFSLFSHQAVLVALDVGQIVVTFI